MEGLTQIGLIKLVTSAIIQGVGGEVPQEVENRSLYERKRVLEEIRSFKRPIQKEDFEDH